MLELRQTREFTALEKRDLTRLWGKVVWREGEGAGALYTTVAYLWYGFGAFLALSVVMAVRELAGIAPDLSIQLALAGGGFAIATVTAQWNDRRLQHSKLWTEPRTGDRYALTADGLRANTVRGALACGWTNIETIINDRDRVVALLPGHGGLFMVKAAFDGQDVEGFGAQLVHRWQENRKHRQPESAS
jgi:hypothetical protein